jgi:hypothetical protein
MKRGYGGTAPCILNLRHRITVSDVHLAPACLPLGKMSPLIGDVQEWSGHCYKKQLLSPSGIESQFLRRPMHWPIVFLERNLQHKWGYAWEQPLFYTLKVTIIQHICEFWLDHLGSLAVQRRDSIVQRGLATGPPAAKLHDVPVLICRDRGRKKVGTSARLTHWNTFPELSRLRHRALPKL